MGDYSAGRVIISRILPMAIAEFSPSGQTSAQFMMVRKRNSRYGSSRLSSRGPGFGPLPLPLYDPRTFAPTSAEINLAQGRIDAVQRRFQFVALRHMKGEDGRGIGRHLQGALVFTGDLHGFLNDGSNAEKLMSIGAPSFLSGARWRCRRGSTGRPIGCAGRSAHHHWTGMPARPGYDDGVGALRQSVQTNPFTPTKVAHFSVGVLRSRKSTRATT